MLVSMYIRGFKLALMMSGGVKLILIPARGDKLVSWQTGADMLALLRDDESSRGRPKLAQK